MSRVQSISPEKASSKVKPLYDALQKKLGRIPNIFLNMGNSPAVLKAYFALSEAAGETTLSPMLREQIALVVSQANQCQYCLSAHSAIGKATGLSDNEILLARKGEAGPTKDAAIIRFAKSIVEKRGHLDKTEIETVKKAGVTDQELIEVILVVNLNMFTNYFNHITDPQIDFPEVPKTV